MPHDMDNRCAGRRGALTEPVLLAVLLRGGGHGYDLRAEVTRLTDGDLTLDAAGLYRTLRRLEEDGFVTSRWVAGDAGPQRRTYDITAEGRELAADWGTHLRGRARMLEVAANLLEEGLGGESR